MLEYIGRKVFGAPTGRLLRSLRPLIAQIGELRTLVERWSDVELKSGSIGLRTRVDQGATLDDLLPEAFAFYREAAR